VAAAADLSPLTESLTEIYEAETGESVRFVIGSSGMLSRQVELGAPYDVFLSADAGYVEKLAQSGKIVPDTVRVYALGRLGLWSKVEGVREAKDLARTEIRRVAIANPEHAPYGKAAREYLRQAGVWKAVEPKVVYGENVRQATQFASSGNADALVSSWTMVRPMGGLLVPATAHPPIRQAGGMVAGSTRGAEARRFLELLNGQRARALFQEHGFDEPATSRR
jgi:molybdate transport system substrate-binding protein